MIPATAILVPVLNRPQNARPLFESIEAATPEPHRVLFILSEYDEAERLAVHELWQEGDAREGQDYAPVLDYVIVGGPGTWAQKINVGFHATEEPFIFTGADDLRFHDGWLREALCVANGRDLTGGPLPEPQDGEGPGVIGTDDLCNKRTEVGQHSTHSLVRRAYVDRYSGVMDEPNLVLHEGYAHEYADDELVQTAMHRGRYAHAFSSKVQHLHPMCSETEDDDTYRLGRSGTGRSRRHFNLRSRLWGGDKAFTTRRPRRMGR